MNFRFDITDLNRGTTVETYLDFDSLEAARAYATKLRRAEARQDRRIAVSVTHGYKNA